MDAANGREIKSYRLEEFPQTATMAVKGVPSPGSAPEEPPRPQPQEERPAPGQGADAPGQPAQAEAAAQPAPEETAPPAPRSAPEPPEPPAAQEPPQAPQQAPETPTPEAKAPEAAAPRPLTSEEVTGHTAALWKYLPVPEGEPEPSPEYLSCETDYPGSRVIAARVRGKKHKHEGTCCDDWYETGCFEDITFLAVSDGAGSKRFSRIGAQASCKAAVGCMAKSFAAAFAGRPELRAELRLPLADSAGMDACSTLAGLVQQAVVKAREAVESAYYLRALDPAYRQALGRELELNDLSGTLLAAAVIPVEKQEHLIVSCQVGDGMIAVFNTQGEFSSSLKLLGKPDSGDFSGETEFLTSPGICQLESLQTRTKLSRGPADLVMLMSDGVADDYFPNETELRRLYFDLIANGVLSRGEPLGFSQLSQQQIRQFKKLPDPLAYPWVNDQTVKISLHYTKRILEAAGLTLEELWKDPSMLELAQLELDERLRSASPGRRLELWLDNYVERGSFDDRTLVIARM